MEVPLEKYIEARIAAVEKAIDVAKKTTDERLRGMNEFRETLRDQASKFVTRSELDAIIKPILESLNELKESKAMLAGKASQSQANITLGLSIIAIILAIVKLFQ